MDIDKAIYKLEQAKANGTKTIIGNFWDASGFGLHNGELWDNVVAKVESGINWNKVGEKVLDEINLIIPLLVEIRELETVIKIQNNKIEKINDNQN